MRFILECVYWFFGLDTDRAYEKKGGVMKTVTSKAEIPITGLILAYNEEAIIEDAINNLMPHVKEVVVVDTGSTDITIALAREAGARVVKLLWNNDFAQARNEAMEFVNTEWALFLDADERYEPDFFNLLPALVMQDNLNAFYVWRRSVFDGDLKGEEYQPRLLRTRYCKWVGNVHEGIEVQGAVSNLPREFYMNHVHTMNKQRYNNLLYQNIKNGKPRPPMNRGAEVRDGAWEEFDNERNK